MEVDDGNPWAAAKQAEAEYLNNRNSIVTNEETSKSYAVCLNTGEISCPICGSDVISPMRGCWNCEATFGVLT